MKSGRTVTLLYAVNRVSRTCTAIHTGQMYRHSHKRHALAQLILQQKLRLSKRRDACEHDNSHFDGTHSIISQQP